MATASAVASTATPATSAAITPASVSSTSATAGQHAQQQPRRHRRVGRKDSEGNERDDSIENQLPDTYFTALPRDTLSRRTSRQWHTGQFRGGLHGPVNCRARLSRLKSGRHDL